MIFVHDCGRVRTPDKKVSLDGATGVVVVIVVGAVIVDAVVVVVFKTVGVNDDDANCVITASFTASLPRGCSSIRDYCFIYCFIATWLLIQSF